ncbi:MAG: DUF4177 domain-containing protein [Pseudomonadota bacterium]
MPFEYSVVPAPKKGQKAKGVRSAEDRFANALETIMNAKGAEGWDYVRTDTLPAEERQGLTGTKTVYQNMMVFRRPLRVADAPVVEAPAALIEGPKEEPIAEAPEIPEDAPVEPTFSSRQPAADTDPLSEEPRLRAE